MQPIDHFILKKILELEQRKEEQREGLRIPLPVPEPPHAPPLKKERQPPKKPIIIDMT